MSVPASPTPLPHTPPLPLPPGYEVVGEDGVRAGLGTAYRVRRASTGEPLTLTVLDAPVSADARFRGYFLAVVERLRHIEHAGIVRVVEHGETDGRAWVVASAPEGRTIRSILADGTIDAERAIDLLEPLARALRAASDFGLRHHDLDAGHVLITADDRAVLLEPAFIDPIALPGARESRPDLLTYLPPERLRQAPPDARGDVHLLGGLLLTALTGHPPGSEADRVLRDRERDGAVPQALDLVLWRALAADPMQRPAQPRDLFHQARRALRGERPERFILQPQPSVSGPPSTSTTLVRAGGPGLVGGTGRGPKRVVTRVTAAFSGWSNSAGRAVRDAGDGISGFVSRLRPTTGRTGHGQPPPAASESVTHQRTGEIDGQSDDGEPHPAGSPRAAPRPEHARRRSLLVGLAAAAALIAGSAIVLVTRDEQRATNSAPVAERTEQGPISLTHPPQWQTVDPAPPVLGVALDDPVALEPRGAPGFVPGSATLVAGRFPETGPTLLPPGLAGRLRGRPRGEAIRVGELEGYRYRGLARAGETGTVDLYVFATRQGALAVSCFAGDEVAPAYRRQCEAIAGSLRASGVDPVALGTSSAYATSRQATMTRLNRDRRALRTRLAAVRSPGSQALLSARLAGAFRRAADRLADATPPAAAVADNERIVRQMRLVANGYSRMAAAARAGSREAFNRGRAQVRRREARLDALLRA